MQKLILMSILIATFAIPFIYSAKPIQPRKAIKLVEGSFLAFCVIYVIAIVYVLPRLG